MFTIGEAVTLTVALVHDICFTNEKCLVMFKSEICKSFSPAPGKHNSSSLFFVMMWIFQQQEQTLTAHDLESVGGDINIPFYSLIPNCTGIGLGFGWGWVASLMAIVISITGTLYPPPLFQRACERRRCETKVEEDGTVEIGEDVLAGTVYAGTVYGAVAALLEAWNGREDVYVAALLELERWRRRAQKLGQKKKLFQWVHRKLGQNINHVKNFTLGNPCAPRLTVQLTVDSQYSRAKLGFSSRNHSCFLKPHYQESQTSWCREEQTSAAISELFEGFLTIGTLGAKAVTNEPATPTFATPLENLPTKDADVTETELKLISYKLEKFFEAEEECFYESSRKNSLSNIILSRKQITGLDAEDYGNKTVCPLQGYLLGSSFEIPEEVEVREEWASVAELFQRTKTAKEDCIETRVKEKKVKQAHKSAMHIMKKMWKKVYSSSKSCSTAGNIADSTTTNAKLRKVPSKFHRKVYLKDTINAKSATKSHKGDNRDTGNPDPGRRFHSNSKSKKWSKHCETIWNLSQDGLSCGGSTGNNEHWIKTDAECKFGTGAVATYAV
ncbi:unnamed protein product [Vicia faba]|uniref:Uncharacterized protein n=1 Tax=Vicia faba TaxID=3906 RepID=A0AAV1ANJ7_VICFA|nr:unnamed protein product [Vicia faba]